MKTMAVEILTPESIVFNGNADFMVMPGYSGELGVLPGHVRLFSQIVAGNVRCVQGQTEKKFVIESGFAFIQPDKVKLFTTKARPLSE
jgi:F-type H+-transporting ATPase subunit epsilon